MALGDVVGEYVPDISVSGFSTLVWYFAVVVMLLILLGVMAFFIIRRLKFNKKVIILEDVSGSDDLEPIGRDRAMTVRVGTGGLEVLYLKKRKVYRGAYGKRMGKNTYYFAIGPDGYWYNITLGSLQKGMKNVSIKPTKVNMRYQNESLQEIIKQRYDQPNFWQKYGQLIVGFTFIAFIVLMAYFMFDSFQDAAGSVTRAAEISKEVAIELGKVVGGLESLKSSGGLASG